MGVLTCTYDKPVSTCHDKYGDLLFLVRPYHCAEDISGLLNEAEQMLCHGEIQNYLKGTPLEITYDADESPVYVRSCREKIVEGIELSAFLKSLHLDRETAGCVAGTFGADLFEAVLRDDAKSRFAAAGIPLPILTRLKQVVEEMGYKRNLIEALLPYGVGCAAAMKLYGEYGFESHRTLRKDPYILLRYDVPFEAADRIGARFDDGAPERLDALVSECLRRNEQSGHSCVVFGSLCQRTDRLSRDTRGDTAGISAFETAAAVAMNNRFVCRTMTDPGEGVDDPGQTVYRVYRSAMDRFEHSAAFHTVRLIRTERTVPLSEERITEIEAELGVRYAGEQRAAFSLFGGVSVLTGGPGTGKTMTLNGLLRYFRMYSPGAKIALCAPTAAAAKRMKESTGMTAVTVHKLLEVRPTGFGGYTSKNEFSRLDYDLVIVDECSMVDLQLYSMLVASIRDGAMLLLVGDSDQLPSVGPGNVLSDLLKCPSVRRVNLTRVFRQEECSSIVQNSAVIRTGCGRPVFDDASEIMVCSTEEDIMSRVVDTMGSFYDRTNPFSVRLLTPSRNPHYAIQTEALNHVFQDMFGSGKTALTYGTRKFMPGDPVVFLRNNYVDGYCNGDTGAVLEIRRSATGADRLLVALDDGEIAVSGANLADVAPAYATTIHKAQGSECSTGIIVLPGSPAVLLKRSLLYVAATRARQKNIFIVQNMTGGNSFQYAMRNVWTSQRVSGLWPRIAALLGPDAAGKERDDGRDERKEDGQPEG